jgi:hypothetical protein
MSILVNSIYPQEALQTKLSIDGCESESVPECPLHDDIEYSDPDLEDTDVSSARPSEPFLILDPILDVVLRTAIKEEQGLSISCDRFCAIQDEMIPQHRETVVKWLTQLNHRFKFSSDTLSNALMTFDLVSMRIGIPKSQIQIYAVGCYCLAIKADTRTCPTSEQLNAMTGIGITTAQMAEKETEILRILEFRLSYPTIKFYTRIYLDALKPVRTVSDVVNLFVEIGMSKFAFLDFRQSIVALTAMILGSATLGFPLIALNAVMISHCTEKDELLRCVSLLRAEAETVVKNWNKPSGKGVFDLFASINFTTDMTPFVSIINNKILA